MTKPALNMHSTLQALSAHMHGVVQQQQGRSIHLHNASIFDKIGSYYGDIVFYVRGLRGGRDKDKIVRRATKN